MASNSWNKIRSKYLLICHGPWKSSHETIRQLEEGKKTGAKPGEFEYWFIHYDPVVLRHGFNEGKTYFLCFSRLLTSGSQLS